MMNLEDLTLDQMRLAIDIVVDWQIGRVLDPIKPIGCLTNAEARQEDEALDYYAMDEDAGGHIIYYKYDRNLQWLVTEMVCFPVAESKGGFLKEISYERKRIRRDPGRVIKPCFYPKGFKWQRSHGYGEGPPYYYPPCSASWVLEGSIGDHPTHTYSLLPARHTLRGQQILKQILQDMENMLFSRPVQYLAVYSRNLLTIENVQANFNCGAIKP